MMIRSFLPVGQGAFYTENFKDGGINVVYDCGSSTDVKIVEDQIRSTFEKNETIHAVFISHLHDDHVNGLEYLLKYCNVQKIYFPLISKENKIIMSIYHEISSSSSFLRSFLNNPRDVIDADTQIIGVREHGYDETNDNVDVVDSGTNVAANVRLEEWIYIPFNFRQSDRCDELLDNFKKIFKDGISNEDIEYLWKNGSQSDKDKIVNCYKNIKGDLNINSMTLFSGKIDKKSYQYICGFKYNHHRHNCYRCHCLYQRFRYLSGCLYTGDYCASGTNKWDELKTNYENQWDYIGCVQTPHHGSRHNFNNKFAKMDVLHVISAGYSNKYSHPHSEVIKQLLMNHHFPYIVTEHTGSAVYTLISW